MNTEASSSCPKCHAPIPPEAPQGLCPKCLLASASIPTEAGHSVEAQPPPSLETVATAFPQLEISEFIGQGGMGVVFKARQPKLDRFVALKLLSQKPGADPAFPERFNREARVLARLSHPNIVAVHDFGQAGPFFYLLMEFVDGVNLRQAMRAGRFTPAQALALVPKICDALQYAHEEGVLHRDIKPENLLLDTRGRLKIADFGIAKILGDAKDITLTAHGAMVGTPHYMAPEQFEHPHDVDQRADVFSLGVVFYEMLTGELPIGRFVPPSEKAEMDPRVDRVVMRTLEKERERRFQSAGDVKTQVEMITASAAAKEFGPTGAPNHPAGGEPPPPVQPNPPSAPASGPSGWSLRALGAAALVGFSFLLVPMALFLAREGGGAQAAMVLLMVGLPALAGTILAGFALGEFLAKPSQLQGDKLALYSAVAWPLVLLDILLLGVPLLLAKSPVWHRLGLMNGPMTRSLFVVGVLASLVPNVFILRYLGRRWSSERASSHPGLQALFGRTLRVALCFLGVALSILVLVLLIVRGRVSHVYEPAQLSPSWAHIVPSGYAGGSPLTPGDAGGVPVPPGYEGGVPMPPGYPDRASGNDSRVHRSTVTVPPGYVLTVAAILCSNQVVLKPGLPNAAAWLMAPEGAPVQGQLTWRLLGITAFADGAPLQFSLGLLQGSDKAEKSFHIVPPEPVAIDWVGEPAQVWPPQNGHTTFPLVQGWSADSGAPVQPATEWGAGVETRLDPVPASILRNLKSPVVGLGTNWLSTLENAGPTSAGSVAPSEVLLPGPAAAEAPETLPEK